MQNKWNGVKVKNDVIFKVFKAKSEESKAITINYKARNAFPYVLSECMRVNEFRLAFNRKQNGIQKREEIKKN